MELFTAILADSAVADPQPTPWFDLLPVILVLVIGLILWLVGGRILPTAMAGAGILFGGLIGWLMGEWFGAGGMALWAMAAGGGVICLILAIVAYRLVVAVVFALTLALFVPLAVWTAAEAGVIPIEQPEEQIEEVVEEAPAGEEGAEPTTTPTRTDDLPDRVRSWLEEILGQQPDARMPIPLEELPEEDRKRLESLGIVDAEGMIDSETAQRYMETISEAARRLVDRLEAIWDAVPQSLRPTLLIAAACSALIGLLLGTLAASVAASAITAILGAGIVLGSGMGLIEARFPQSVEWLPQSAMGWAGWWLGIAVIGLVFQLMLRPRAADTTRRN